MARSPWIATWLDEQMLVAQGVFVSDAVTVGVSLPAARSGSDVARELQGRLLLKYVTVKQVRRGEFRHGSSREAYATLTPYATEDVVSWLQLPDATEPRRHILLLDVTQISRIIGPYRVTSGRGIQYLLPDGFPEEAIVVPGAPGGHWAIEVR